MVRPASDHDRDMVASVRPPAGRGTSPGAAVPDRYRKLVGHAGPVAAAAMLGTVLAGPSLLSAPSGIVLVPGRPRLVRLPSDPAD